MPFFVFRRMVAAAALTLCTASLAIAATFNMTIYGPTGFGTFEISDSALETDGIVRFASPEFLSFSLWLNDDYFELADAVSPTTSGVRIEGGVATSVGAQFTNATGGDVYILGFAPELAYAPSERPWDFSSGEYAISGPVVPLPAGLPLALTGVLGFAVLRLRRGRDMPLAA